MSQRLRGALRREEGRSERHRFLTGVGRLSRLRLRFGNLFYCGLALWAALLAATAADPLGYRLGGVVLVLLAVASKWDLAIRSATESLGLSSLAECDCAHIAETDLDLLARDVSFQIARRQALRILTAAIWIGAAVYGVARVSLLSTAAHMAVLAWAAGIIGNLHARRSKHAFDRLRGRDHVFKRRAGADVLRRLRWPHKINRNLHHAIVPGFGVASTAALACLAKDPFVWAFTIFGIVGFSGTVLLPPRLLNRPIRERLGVPNSPLGSRLLSLHQPLNYLFDGSWFLAFVMVARRHLELSPDWMSWEALRVLAVIAIMVLGARMIYGRFTFGLLKAAFAGNFRIAVFRRYTPEQAAGHRERLLPIVGAFGYAIAYSDKSLESSPAGPLADSGDELAGISRVMPAGRSDHEWQQRISLELAASDLAVFDWPVEPTESMLFESEVAATVLPPERLIFVLSTETGASVERWIERRWPDASRRPARLCSEKEYSAVARAFYLQLRKLRRTPRSAIEPSGRGT